MFGEEAAGTGSLLVALAEEAFLIGLEKNMFLRPFFGLSKLFDQNLNHQISKTFFTLPLLQCGELCTVLCKHKR